MISSIQGIEYLFDKYGIFLAIIFTILPIINWICKNTFPYYFRKSKLEKMDEYKNKFLELNGYDEKTKVVNKILEAEYGRIILNERNITKQKIMIFLLHHNLCRTIKEAKKIARYLVFKKPQKSLVFNKTLFISGISFIFIFIILFFVLFAYFKSELKQSNTNFDVYKWFILSISSYVICIILSLIFSDILVNSINSSLLIKKNHEIISKISSRLSELNAQRIKDTEKNVFTEKLAVKKEEVKTLKEKLTVERNKKISKLKKSACHRTLKKQVSFK